MSIDVVNKVLARNNNNISRFLCALTICTVDSHANIISTLKLLGIDGGYRAKFNIKLTNTYEVTQEFSERVNLCYFSAKSVQHL